MTAVINKSLYAQIRDASDNGQKFITSEQLEEIADRLSIKMGKYKHNIRYGDYVVSGSTIPEVKEALKTLIPKEEWSNYDL